MFKNCMKSCLDCWLCKKRDDDYTLILNNCCMATGGFNLGGMKNCKIGITDEDIEAARKESAKKKLLTMYTTTPMAGSNMNLIARTISCVGMDPGAGSGLKTSFTWTVPYSRIVGLRKVKCQECGEQIVPELYNDKCDPSVYVCPECCQTIERESLTCSSCSFASKSVPISISSHFPLPEGVFYCPERGTRVPGSLEGCELYSERKEKNEKPYDEEAPLGQKTLNKIASLYCAAPLQSALGEIHSNVPDLNGRELHSERKKDTESILDEINSLDNTIDECFHEMKRLIDAGGLGKQKDARLSALKVSNNDLTEENKTLRTRFLDAVDSYSECTEKYSSLVDEHVKLKDKLTQIRDELSGKWRLLEVGERPRTGDQIYVSYNGKFNWTAVVSPCWKTNERHSPIRRKITI